MLFQSCPCYVLIHVLQIFISLIEVIRFGCCCCRRLINGQYHKRGQTVVANEQHSRQRLLRARARSIIIILCLVYRTKTKVEERERERKCPLLLCLLQRSRAVARTFNSFVHSALASANLFTPQTQYSPSYM